MQGWISLHRKILNSSIWGNPNLLKLWIYCLLRANFDKRDILVGLQKVHLESGQFTTGRFTLGEDFNRGAKNKDIIDERKLWRWLKALERADFLSIKSYSKYSVITINNWNLYQPNRHELSKEYTTNYHQMSSENPMIDHQLSTDNNVNNKKNENKKKNEENEENAPSRVPEINHQWFKKFSQCFNLPPNAIQIKDIQSYLEQGIEEELVMLAFEKAGMKSASYPYAQSILKGWSQKGILSLGQQEAESKDFFNLRGEKLNGRHMGRLRIRFDGRGGITEGKVGRLYKTGHEFQQERADKLL